MGIECSKDNWRNAHQQLAWTSEFKMELINEIKDIRTFRSVTPNIVLAGPVAAGKSSCVNTFLSAGRKKMVQKANVGTDIRSLTLKYTRYEAVGLVEHKYRICDTMGFLDKSDKGLSANDLRSVIRGHIAPDYQFDEKKDIQPSDDKYVSNPSEMDKSHCLVVVLSVEDVKTYQDGYINEVKNAIRSSRKEDIPAYIILTKVDKICDAVKKDNSKIFKCIHARDAVAYTSELLGLPEGYIFPVINYSAQVIKSDAIEIVALLTLKILLQPASDYLEGTEFIKDETAK